MLTLSDVTFEEATSEDALVLVALLSESDRRDAADMLGPLDIEHFILRMVTRSGFSVAVKADGKLVAIYGYNQRSALSTVIHPWVLFTEWGRRHASPKGLQKVAKRTIQTLRNQGYRLETPIPERNKVALIWLKRLGFSISKPTIHTMSGGKARKAVLQ